MFVIPPGATAAAYQQFDDGGLGLQSSYTTRTFVSDRNSPQHIMIAARGCSRLPSVMWSSLRGRRSNRQIGNEVYFQSNDIDTVAFVAGERARDAERRKKTRASPV